MLACLLLAMRYRRAMVTQDRRLLLDQIADYARRYPDESVVAERFAAFVAAHADCFERRCVPGHVTGSAWLVSHDGARFLLTHHRKLGRWLQLGGHADGDPDPARVALREATEESGITGLRLATVAGRVEPLDLDAHEIPARGDEPAHVHYDVRYVVVAPPDATLAISDESLALRWFPSAEPLAVPHDESVARLQRKARRGRGSPAVTARW
jgi:8-oxo-dGTP pyrophosphatase MutT (NUDIX family)